MTRMMGNMTIGEINNTIVNDKNLLLKNLELTCLSKALGVTIVVRRIPGANEAIDPEALKTAKVYEAAVRVAPILHLLTDGSNYYMLYPYDFNAVDGYVNTRFAPTDPPCQMQ